MECSHALHVLTSMTGKNVNDSSRTDIHNIL